MNINETITQWVNIARQKGYVSKLDTYYVTNQLLHLLGVTQYKESISKSDQTLHELTEQLVSFAVLNGVIEDSSLEREALYMKVMDMMTPLPSVVNDQFHQAQQTNPEQATQQFYQLVCDNGYIQQKAIAKNVHFMHESDYGALQITINLSKPEKDPKDIVKALSQPKSTYPETLLTFSNEGYYGNANHPARSNHRLIRLNLNGETFGLQYSPYAYFNEHCIVLSEKVHPMHIDETTIRQLLDVQDMLPHYTFGSNADLAIVGGSILTHHHFQGGRHVFPMENARVREAITLPIKNVKAGWLHWPLSVIRLFSQDKESLIQAFCHVFEAWKNYTDQAVNIVSHTDNVRHNTITPIVRYKNEQYELDLVLRNNRTTPQHPDGIFHPREAYHHIKKENIGLIEVMGLAILPGRLKAEMQEVKKFLQNEKHDMPSYHEAWAKSLVIDDDMDGGIQKGIGDVFTKVLEDAGVFKQDEAGIAAFHRFIDTLQ
ncbi:UDP-glucose--hexose-1-phosphate uridylyltransferase [Carnobacteriaceae bacterium zg-C25]|nr:UDP-glucose--hexose-1-phosphate uridylyltransferase [Carnobacteriaceae bacterium zg-C25]